MIATTKVKFLNLSIRSNSETVFYVKIKSIFSKSALVFRGSYDIILFINRTPFYLALARNSSANPFGSE